MATWPCSTSPWAEADLGIDSIKRVEILAAVQDQVPGLPEVDAAHMGTLQTLGAIVDYMQGLLGTPAPATTAAPAAPAAPGVNLKALMLDVVADKTGYPADMLDLSMELEADLGIDSIKRVEILAAVQDQVPGPRGDAAHGRAPGAIDYAGTLGGPDHAHRWHTHRRPRYRPARAPRPRPGEALADGAGRPLGRTGVARRRPR